MTATPREVAICPQCRMAAASITDRREPSGVHVANCLCARGHMWEIRWNGGA